MRDRLKSVLKKGFENDGEILKEIVTVGGELSDTNITAVVVFSTL